MSLVKPLGVFVPDFARKLSEDLGFDLQANDAARTWRCPGTLEGPCATGRDGEQGLVATRGAYCPGCAVAVGAAMRKLTMKGARDLLPEDALTFPALRARAERDRRLDLRIVEAAETWRRGAGSMSLLGTSGTGKSSSALALVRRIIDTAERVDLPPGDLAFAKGVRFIEARDLAQARKRHKLGNQEAPLERAARAATLLVLDDLGKEDARDQQPVVEAILGRRTATTIVTSELDPAAITARYGVAIRRRVLEQARVVEAFR
jgi:DNA replication protein DnaC